VKAGERLKGPLYNARGNDNGAKSAAMEMKGTLLNVDNAWIILKYNIALT
jgi:hypothetical protein